MIVIRKHEVMAIIFLVFLLQAANAGYVLAPMEGRLSPIVLSGSDPSDTSFPDLPTPHYHDHLGTTLAFHRGLMCGGVERWTDKAHRECFIFDAVERKWSYAIDLIKPRARGNAVHILSNDTNKEYVWIIGGHDGDVRDGYYQTTELITISHEGISIREGPNLPQVLKETHALFLASNKVFIAGSVEKDQKFYRYDLDTQSFSEIAVGKERCDGSLGQSVDKEGNRLLLLTGGTVVRHPASYAQRQFQEVEGSRIPDPSQIVELLSPEEDFAIRAQDLPFPLYRPILVEDNNGILYALSGYAGGEDYGQNRKVLSFKDGKWEVDRELDHWYDTSFYFHFQ